MASPTTAPLPDGVTVVAADDERVALYFNLKERDLSALGEYFILEGENSIYNLVQHGRIPLISVCISLKRAESMRDLIAKLAGVGVPVYALEQAELNSIVGFDFHRGVLGLGTKLPSRPASQLLAEIDSPKTLLLCEKVNNLDNTGAVFRNAAAFGVDAVIFDAKSSDPYYRKSIRVSGGHALVIPFTRHGTIAENIAAAKASGHVVVAMVTPHVRPDLPKPIEIAKWRSVWGRPGKIAVLVGAEGPGLSDEAQELADVRLTIPMGIDSVNVATASAIALHELTAPRSSFSSRSILLAAAAVVVIALSRRR